MGQDAGNAKLKDAELRDAERIVEQRRRKRKDPRRVADAVSRLLSRYGYAQMEGTIQLQQCWHRTLTKELACEALAVATRPTAVKRGVLEVAVRNSVSLQELGFRKRQILRKLQQTEIGSQIRDLRFRIAPVD